MRATSGRRRADHRHGLSRGYVGNARGAQAIAPPSLRDGQVRCPVCRNGSQVTDRGYLRRHKDLFGHTCYNVALPEDAA